MGFNRDDKWIAATCPVARPRSFRCGDRLLLTWARSAARACSRATALLGGACSGPAFAFDSCFYGALDHQCVAHSVFVYLARRSPPRPSLHGGGERRCEAVVAWRWRSARLVLAFAEVFRGRSTSACDVGGLIAGSGAATRADSCHDPGEASAARLFSQLRFPRWLALASFPLENLCNAITACARLSCVSSRDRRVRQLPSRGSAAAALPRGA